MNTGKITWQDLTVNDAEKVRDFYTKVVGWRAEPVEMGGYSDFNMIPPGGTEGVAGICHARGSNADVPPQWLIYITVDDVESAAAACTASGGTIVAGPRPTGGGRGVRAGDDTGSGAADAVAAGRFGLTSAPGCYINNSLAGVAQFGQSGGFVIRRARVRIPPPA